MAKKNEKETNQTAEAKTAGSQAEGAVMDESAREKFQQKLRELLALAKKKKNMLLLVPGTTRMRMAVLRMRMRAAPHRMRVRRMVLV